MTLDISTLNSALNLQICCVNEEFPINHLSKQGQRQFAEINNDRKRSYWLKGRNALKKVLNKLGDDIDPSEVRFPNQRFSITHSGEFALAIGCKQNIKLKGIGIDIELNRLPRDGSEKYFLTKAETNWLHSLDIEDQPLHRLRLWTIKEAVYKAYPHNSQIRLTHLETKNPEQESGKILIQDSKLSLEEKIKCNYFCYSLPLNSSDQGIFDFINYTQLPKGVGYLSIALLFSPLKDLN